MCPSKQWFETYHEVNGGKVLLRNNKACNVVGIGNVKIRMQDGIERTLTNVRHIPELKKNLISLGTLDMVGCTIKAGNGVLKVYKGSLVAMKGVRVNGLYLLQGISILGTVAVVHNQKTSKSQKWHMRLGHLSEKGLQKLAKQGLVDCDQAKLEFCEHCIYGKQHRVKFHLSKYKSKRTLEYIYSNS